MAVDKRAVAPMVAAAIGVAAGILARHVPVDAAFALAGGGSRPRECGMERVLECAFDNIDDVVGLLLRALLYLVAITIVCLAGGVGAVVVGAVRRRLALIVVGAAVATPALWAAASLAWSIAVG